MVMDVSTTAYSSDILPSGQRSTWYQIPMGHPTDPRVSLSESRISTSYSQSLVPITAVLLESQPLELAAATQAPFLLASAQGKLPKSVLSKWLSQARLVTQGQISLLGALMARVDLPYIFIPDEKKSASVRWRVMNVLMEALQRAQQDLSFYTDIAKRYDLNQEFPPRPDVFFTADYPAKQFIELFRAFWTDPTMTLLEGMVVYWATVHCRLTSFKFAGKYMNLCERIDERPDGGAFVREFVPHWTGVDFEKFATEVTEATNMLSLREEGYMKMSIFKVIWQHILDIETRLWPEI